MPDGETRPELVAAMLEPGFYPDRPPSVELRETHISWVFLAGERAYKVKKPLTLPFLDYGSVGRRHELCEEEVRLNRRFAPNIYLGVVGIADHAHGWRLVADDDPEAIEYAVEMRRIDEARSVAALAACGELTRDHVRAVARRLAELHAQAPVVPAEARGLAPLIASLDENLATLREDGGEALEKRRIAAAANFTDAFLAARRDLLETRARDGWMRDCHGDLRAEHVIVPVEGDVFIFDCVEFDPALRRIDVGVDFAFLVMDLAALGESEHALALVDDYREAGGEPGDDATLAFFAAYRAWVRAKVACVRGLELPQDDPERVEQEELARRLLELGHRFAWRARRPLVLVLCGVSASGKTTLARASARISGWPHLSSDVTRKRLAGLAPTERAGQDAYSEEFTSRTYRELGAAAGAEAGSSGGVIVDATFHRRAERAAFFEGLTGADVPALFVECRAPTEVLLARARRRQRDPTRVSDANPAIVESQLAAFEPLDELDQRARAAIDTDRPPEELVGALEQIVDAHAWGPEEGGARPVS